MAITKAQANTIKQFLMMLQYASRSYHEFLELDVEHNLD